MVSRCFVHHKTQRNVARVALTPANKIEHPTGIFILHFLKFVINLIFKFVKKFSMMLDFFYSVIHWGNVSSQYLINTFIYFSLSVGITKKESSEEEDPQKKRGKKSTRFVTNLNE